MQTSSNQGIAISKTDIRKVISYLNDACRLYEALPMQSLKNRAFVIRQLTAKLNSKITSYGNNK